MNTARSATAWLVVLLIRVGLFAAEKKGHSHIEHGDASARNTVVVLIVRLMREVTGASKCYFFQKSTPG